MKVYIAGPMRGYPNYNFAAFDKARDELLAEGFTVISPADLDRVHWGVPMDYMPEDDKVFSHDETVEFMRRDLALLMTFEHGKDSVYLLPGWENSVGSAVEVKLARYLGLSLRIRYFA